MDNLRKPENIENRTTESDYIHALPWPKLPIDICLLRRQLRYKAVAKRSRITDKWQDMRLWSERLLNYRIPPVFPFDPRGWRSNVQPLRLRGKGINGAWNTLVHSKSHRVGLWEMEWPGVHVPQMIELDETVWVRNAKSCHSLFHFF